MMMIRTAHYESHPLLGCILKFYFNRSSSRCIIDHTVGRTPIEVKLNATP